MIRPVSNMSSEIKGLSQVEGGLIQIDDGHIKPRTKHKPKRELLSFARKQGTHLFIWGLRDLTV